MSDLNYSFSADYYNSGRPEYLPQQIQEVLEKLGLDSNSVVMDVGAGTGKLSKSIAPYVKQVICVEPDLAMQEQLEKLVPELGEKIKIVKQRAQAMVAIGDHTVDAIVMGDAAHHLDAHQVLPEFHRVLKDSKRIAVFTRRPDPESSVVQALHNGLMETDANYQKPGAFRIIEVGQGLGKKQGKHLIADGAELLKQRIVEYKTQDDLWQYLASRKWSKNWAQQNLPQSFHFNDLFDKYADTDGKVEFPRISYALLGTLKSLEKSISQTYSNHL